eukprot:CAMPEP_0119037862 /NCGR_PEP_ID=MMETSP1177-20130426/6396_1 /TAXON_ID=2985 /ORGANISM="Ochromonas sp, Strain CCMP1899" /LENGTH=259 /DNA_ID=CAMNT_0006999615 /DNA_START=507 /DNA_END=1286 /DNA_ORIENTATION=+
MVDELEAELAREEAHEALTQQVVVRGGKAVEDPTSAKYVSPPRLSAASEVASLAGKDLPGKTGQVASSKSAQIDLLRAKSMASQKNTSVGSMKVVPSGSLKLSNKSELKLSNKSEDFVSPVKGSTDGGLKKANSNSLIKGSPGSSSEQKLVPSFSQKNVLLLTSIDEHGNGPNAQGGFKPRTLTRPIAVKKYDKATPSLTAGNKQGNDVMLRDIQKLANPGPGNIFRAEKKKDSELQNTGSFKKGMKSPSPIKKAQSVR